MPRSFRSPALVLVLALGACNQMTTDGDGGIVSAAGDECGATAFQGYVGQRVDALNDVELPAGSRVLFPTTPATMDFNPARLNVGIDAEDQIDSVYCG